MNPTAPAFRWLSLPLLAALALSAPPAHAADNLAVRWNETLLECIRNSRLGPPMVARAVAVAHTCGYDAWACYDDRAVATRLGGELRRPAAERTLANREKAYSYGIYRALLDLFPDQSSLIRARMSEFGFDPDDASTDPATPQGLGNVCAAAVLTYRHGDGSNQLGDRHPGAYSDYTGYQPVNPVDRILDPNRWQPQAFDDGQGGRVVPGYIGPHWGQVEPFALKSADQFRPPPPHFHPHGRYVAQANEVLQLNARLDDRQKVIAEYWADGPRSELPPGHWMMFGNTVSRRDGHDFDTDVKLFFVLGNAIMDAGIATWEAKRHYDYVRPVTAIHYLKRGKKVLATVPFEGRKVIDGEAWRPYQPVTFITPPFPEYTSGHSAFSAAGAEVLKRFTGSDAFGGSVTIPAGWSKVEPGLTPAQPVTLYWSTFSDAADEAGISRLYGGIHFRDGDVEGRKLGRRVAAAVWEKAMALIGGESAGGAAAAAFQPEPFAVEVAQAAGGQARVSFTLRAGAEVRLRLVDVRGRRVADLAQGQYPAGTHEVVWDGRAQGVAASSGVYFVHGEAGGRAVTERFVFIR